MPKFNVIVEIEVEAETEGQAVTAVDKLLPLLGPVVKHDIKSVDHCSSLQDIPKL